MTGKQGRGLRSGFAEQGNAPSAQRDVVRRTAQLESHDTAGVRVQAELGLKATRPVDCGSRTEVGAVPQTPQPAGSDILVGKPTVNPLPAEPALAATAWGSQACSNRFI